MYKFILVEYIIKNKILITVGIKLEKKLWQMVAIKVGQLVELVNRWIST